MFNLGQFTDLPNVALPRTLFPLDVDQAEARQQIGQLGRDQEWEITRRFVNAVSNKRFYVKFEVRNIGVRVGEAESYTSSIELRLQ